LDLEMAKDQNNAELLCDAMINTAWIVFDQTDRII
jgi:hypothetical protein